MQVAILARSSREMSLNYSYRLTVHELASQFGLAIFYTRKTSKTSGKSGRQFVCRFEWPATGLCRMRSGPSRLVGRHRIAIVVCAADGDGGDGCVCVCVHVCARACACVCARACMRACVCACVMCLQYTIKYLTKADNNNN